MIQRIPFSGLHPATVEVENEWGEKFRLGY